MEQTRTKNKIGNNIINDPLEVFINHLFSLELSLDITIYNTIEYIMREKGVMKLRC